MGNNGKAFDTAEGRWEGIGPYYAMFPIRFAESVIGEYTSIGDVVLDPFAGRGTAVFSAAVLGRRGLGIEISPVGWIYAMAKLAPAPIKNVERRLIHIVSLSTEFAEQSQSLPRFFKKCFSPAVRRFLLAARANLDWRRSACDRTLMAILLVYLHGKEGQALSNQMRQTKAMSPVYAIRWWAENGKEPPELNVVEFMQQRIRWRYAKGVVQATDSRVYLGNSLSVLARLEQYVSNRRIPKVKLLLTSPPYFGVTNYHYDQWLRLWLLGFETEAYVNRGPYQCRFTNQPLYRQLLRNAFLRAARVLADDGVIYVRTSRESLTLETTEGAIREAFPGRHQITIDKPFLRPTQTHLFGDRSPKTGEVDLVLVPK